MLPDKAPVFPVRAWPVEAYEHEPAHGFFVRLAKENCAQSTSIFAETMGLNGLDFVPAQLLEFCLQMPFRSQEYLVAATPVLDDRRVILNGESFCRKTDWSLERPRVCTACLAENNYYRNWWDLTILMNCPLHDLPLIRGRDNATLAWWFPEIGRTPDGVSLVGDYTLRIENPKSTWDGYVLGRLGVISKQPVEVLDNSEMADVIDAMELLGRLAISGWSKTPPCRTSYSSKDRHYILETGFTMVLQGHARIEQLIMSYVESGRNSSEPHLDSTLYRVFGWIWPATKNLSDNSVSTLIRRSIMVVAHQLGLETRLDTRGRDLGSNMPTALRPLAKKFGVSPKRLREFCLSYGFLTKKTKTGVYHSFSVSEVEAIKQALESTVSPKEACIILGLTPKSFRNLNRAGFIEAVCHAGTAGARFRQSELQAFLQSVRSMSRAEPVKSNEMISLTKYGNKMKRSIAAVVKCILAGEQPITWCYEYPGLQGCMILRDGHSAISTGSRPHIDIASHHPRADGPNSSGVSAP
jgi:hypothetical protein